MFLPSQSSITLEDIIKHVFVFKMASHHDDGSHHDKKKIDIEFESGRKGIIAKKTLFSPE